MENTKGSWKVFIAIILAGLLIAMSVLLSATLVASRIDKGSRTITKGFLQVAKSLTQAADYRRGGRGPQPKQPAPGTKTVEGVTAGTNPLKGKKEAPVLLVEFSDFQCPFSKMFYKKSMPQLEEEYIKTGKVKFAYRDFALNFHPQAKAAAAACRCAGKQKKYWRCLASSWPAAP